MKSSTTDRALRILAQRPMTAGELGTQIWHRCPKCGGSIKATNPIADLVACLCCDWVGPRPHRGRIASASGGGDYAAQMLLGRMRKKGLVRGALPSAGYERGATVWTLTAKGRKEAEAIAVVIRFRKNVWF